MSYKQPGLEVTYLDKLGTDLTVVNAARVSFGKTVFTINDKDIKLLKYLAKHNHWSPFSHPQIQFHIRAPIFVARQLHKHMIGLNISLAHNEISRRYVDSDPEFYIPQVWRKRPEESIKQGSGEDFPKDVSDEISSTVKNVIYNQALQGYYCSLEEGVSPELARMLLPQSMITEWIWTGSLLSFFRIIELRCDEHAQYESRVIAEQIKEYVQEHFPISYEAWIHKK